MQRVHQKEYRESLNTMQKLTQKVNICPTPISSHGMVGTHSHELAKFLYICALPVDTKSSALVSVIVRRISCTMGEFCFDSE